MTDRKKSEKTDEKINSMISFINIYKTFPIVHLQLRLFAWPKPGVLLVKDYSDYSIVYHDVLGIRGTVCLEHGLLLSGTIPLDCMELGPP